MLITRTSPNGRTATLDVPCTLEQLDRWRMGLALIQDALPQVPAPLREFVKTGISPEEWEEMFGSHPGCGLGVP
jgi:hypothetical protein